jgi:hypothetical protein
MKNTLLYIILMLCLLQEGCKNIYEEFEMPSVEITSLKALSKDSCEITVTINKGVGAVFTKTYISFADVTDTTQNITYGLKLTNDQEQAYTTKIKVKNAYHDYSVKAVLETQKNTYSSASRLLYLSQNYNYSKSGIKYVDVYHSETDQIYLDEYHSIGAIPKPGKWFFLKIYYYQLPPSDSKVEVKLNDSITVPSSMSYLGWLYDGDTSCEVTVPSTLSPGDYTVTLYLNGNKFVAPSKIRILPGSSSIKYINNIPDSWGDYYWLFTYFQSGSKLYYLFRNPVFSVVTFDLATQTWAKRNNLPNPQDITKRVYDVNPQTVEYLGDRYIGALLINKTITTGNRLEIWKYAETTDTWSVETVYPGMAVGKTIMFVAGNKLYVGGGTDLLYNYVTDFWQYDFTTKVWTRKSDISPIINQTRIASCTSGNRAYVFTNARQLYMYNPENDTWQLSSTLEGGSTWRYSAALISGDNGKLYLVGGSYNDGTQITLRDTWEYNINTGIWTLKNVYTDAYPYLPFIGTVPTFYYNGKIEVGYALNYYETKQYFIEITP